MTTAPTPTKAAPMRERTKWLIAAGFAACLIFGYRSGIVMNYTEIAGHGYDAGFARARQATLSLTCADLANQAAAQRILRADRLDPYGLADEHGIACPGLPGPYDRAPVAVFDPHGPERDAYDAERAAEEDYWEDGRDKSPTR